MMVLAPLVLGTQLLLVADGPPALDVSPGCQAATRTGLADRSPDLCMNEENAARTTLNDRWGQFKPAQRARCSNLVKMGGPPSYIELLTCLEMAEQADQIPDAAVMRDSVGSAVRER